MLNNDFKEFAGFLNACGAEYLVVGGYALAAFGHPRYTGDLDFWIGCDPANARKVLEALRLFGFGAVGITQEDLTRPEQVIQLGFPPGRIDLLTTIDGVDFRSCFERRWEVVTADTRLNIISLEDFKANKRATGRAQDKADLERLGEPDA